MDYNILLAVLSGILVLLLLILVLKIHAFLSLLIASIWVGIACGMPAADILQTIKNGMGGTLGFVATVVGLGALFGAILEQSGGAQSLAAYMLKKTGEKRAPLAMMATGFLVAIPVFFDVAFIILLPMAIALHKKSKKSILIYAIPLLAGLAITHSFIPPTPGPVAVAEIMGAQLGWVIIFGFVIGLPTALISGPLFANYIANKIPSSDFQVPEPTENKVVQKGPSPGGILVIIFLPIVLIVVNNVYHTFFKSIYVSETLIFWVDLLGHPFTALIAANLLAWYFLGIKRGFSTQQLQKISNKSLIPAGSIILLTGAGGVFKQILVDTGAGNMIASTLNESMLPPVVFAFILAAVVRVLQGSATVAMTTAAGITAPILSMMPIDEMHTAILVIAIASGATMLSHVNDSGFWLVSQYLHLNEKNTFKTWTAMTCIIGLCGLVMSTVLWYAL